MIIDRNSPIPLYYQLKLHFKNQMENGSLHAGDRLPTEMELCDQFGISRAPVRQALTELAREGLIYRRPGQGSFVAPTATATMKQKTKIRVLSHYDVRWMTSLEQAILTWNARHTDQELQLDVRMCSRDDFHELLRRSVIQGEAPDLTPMDYAWVHHYATDGYLTPLDRLDAVWADGVMQDMELPVLKNNVIKGHLYGVPVQADITGLWYRKDWFAQEGVTPPTTWSEWLALLDHFAAPDVRERLGHQYAVVLPVTSATGEATVNLLIAFLWLAGGQVVNAQGQIALQDPGVYEALHFLQKITLERRSYLPSDVYRSRWWDLVRFFAHGVVPMALGGSYEWPRIREESQWEEEAEAAANLGFVMLPRPNADVTPTGSLGGTSWAIFEQSPVQELCAEVLKLVSSRDLARAFCEENLQISPYVSLNAEFRDPAHPWLSQVVPMLQYARNRPMVRHYIRVSNFLQKMFEEVLWDGADVEAAVRRTSQALSLVLTEQLL